MKNLVADIVIVGGGTAGLPAAVTAAEGGARVILFEKRGSTGGTFHRGNIIFGVESKSQLANPPYQTVEQVFQTHMEYTRWHGDPLLVKNFYKRSGETIDWLKSEGVEFQQFIPPASFSFTTGAKKGHGPPPGGGEVIKLLTAKARQLGVTIFCKTSVRKIFKSGKTVTGVIAEEESGEEIQVRAKAVIIATGGCGNNPEMINKYTIYHANQDMFVVKVLGTTGDGIRMAWDAGAADTVIRMQLLHVLPPPYDNGPGFVSDEFGAFRTPNLMVNLLGERFAPEDLRTGMGHALSRQKDRCGFMIIDSDTLKSYEKQKSLQQSHVMIANDHTFDQKGLDYYIIDASEKGYKHVFMANSIEELCKQTGINQAGLERTITEYNHYAETGNDEMFGKNPQYLQPVRRPKFYVARFLPGAYGAVGGIRINHRTEVVDKNYEVLPGLYASGNDANDIYNDSYVPLFGNMVGFAVNTGRIAAENALEYIKTVDYVP